MGSNPESMIKKSISQTIVEEMFRDLGFYVLRMGQEDIANPLTQLEWFIKKCGGKFKLEKNSEEEYSEIDYLKKLPDFCVIDKEGRVMFIEVKYRQKGMLNEKQLGVLEFYPETFVLVVNLEVGENVLFIDKEKPKFERIEGFNTDNLKNSRFYILFSDRKEGEEKEDILTIPFEEWLETFFNIKKSEMIKKYETLVKKWLKEN